MSNHIKYIKTSIDSLVVLKLFRIRSLSETHSDVIRRILEMKPPIIDKHYKIKVLVDEELHAKMYKEFKKVGQTHSEVINEQLDKYIKKYKKELIKQLIG